MKILTIKKTKMLMKKKMIIRDIKIQKSKKAR